jgi:N-hydroxyarylamine O-acetyltransferase
LLTTLGYDVRWHVGGVQRRGGERVGADANHLVLTVHDLPDEQVPNGAWYVDVGLGDALREPLALEPGIASQDGFTYALNTSDVVTRGWRFEHDPRGGFEGMDFASLPDEPSAFEERHGWLSTSPQSGFVRVVTVQRRDATGVDQLRGCVLNRVNGTGAGSTRDVTSYDDWRQAIDVCGLSLDAVPGEQMRGLWRRSRDNHERWDEAGRP